MAEFTGHIEQREKSEIGRLDQVFEMARATQCQAGLLSTHFGQPLASDCGQCSHCLGEGPYKVKLSATDEIPAATIEAVKQLAGQHPAVLVTPRSVARLLCGLTSPALSRSKLSRHKLFGVCQDIPFGTVMQQVEGVAGNTTRGTAVLTRIRTTPERG